jgi:Abnormal spindle-like microcephaly-assoc'd, ASPM-SPD-2-Hydin/Fibronectin type III domain
MSTIRVFYAIHAIFNFLDFPVHTRSSHRPFFGPRSLAIRSLAWLTGSLAISWFCIFLSGCGVLSRNGSLETNATSQATTAQITTACGQTSQSGTDGGNALWQLGTPCATGTNSGGYTVSSISYWVGTPASASFDLGVYSSSSGAPGSLLCSVSTGTISPSSGWNSVNISSCPTLSASTTYWVGYITGSNQVEQGTVSGSCPGTSYHSHWSNSALSSVALGNPFPANTLDSHSNCYSLYMTLNPASGSSQSADTSGPSLTINAQSVSFGALAVNSSATQSIVFTSSGSTPVTIDAVTLSGSGFTISGLSFPVTLNPGQTATLNVEFIPAIVGSTTGQLTVTSNSLTNATMYIALSGTGQAQAQAYAVNLAWDAPEGSSNPIVGYEVYRSTSGSAQYQLLNSSVDAQTNFTDSNVQPGVTYQYYVTAVASSGAQSSPSNITEVTIP